MEGKAETEGFDLSSVALAKEEHPKSNVCS